jgi:serine/threonine protein kinase
MKTATTPCPSADDLRQLLVNDLTTSQQQACAEHLNECVCCQNRLEVMATEGSNLTELVDQARAADPLETSAYWPALKAIGGSTVGGTKQLTSPAKKHAPLTFLMPPTDAAYLGRIAHFDIMREIGRGGMGVVLEAFDSKLQRHVAIKILSPELADDEVGRQRFCREARAAASISHENVVAVHQVENACERGFPYLVMQLISGETLEQRMKRVGKLPLSDIVRISMQAARGLAAAHERGLIHRDIKPANIILEPPSDRVKLMDFGLARVAEDVKLTRTGLVTGTPLYMSPEQALGDEVDARSDLFSLGAIMYEMISGQTPFQGNSALAILKQISEGKQRPLKQLDPTVPGWIAEMVDELLAKKPADRYQKASDLAEVLEYHWAHQKTSSEELPAVCQVELRRRKIRNRWVLGGIAAAALGLGLAWNSVSGFLFPSGSSTAQPANPGIAPLAVLSANAGSVFAVSFDPTSETVVMGVEDGTVRLWDLKTKSVKSTLDEHRGVIWAARFSRDGKTFVTAADDGKLKVWQPGAAASTTTFVHPNAVRGLAISDDGQRIYAGDRSGGLRVWSPSEEKPLLETEQPGAVYAVAVSPDGETLATAGSDKSVRIWNAKTLTQKQPLSGHAGPVYGLTFSRDGKQLASAGWDKTIRLWDVASGNLIRSWDGHSNDLWAVAFSPDGKHLATAGQGVVKVWNAETGELVTTFKGHDTTVHALAYNREGTMLASGGRDGTVRIWPVNH